VNSTELRGAVLEAIVDNGYRPMTALQIVTAMQSDGLLPPRASGTTIGRHLGDLCEWRYITADQERSSGSSRRRYTATAEGVRVVTHARATATAGAVA
jgi:DNA-binding PadR family transcriptional regulator